MSHTAALYNIRVHKRRHPGEDELLGAIGDDGAQLIWAFGGYLKELYNESDDGRKHIRVTGVEVDEAVGEIRVSHTIGVRGARADHYEDEELRFEQQPEHTAKVRSAALFHLPPSGNLGHVVVYVPHRQGSITLLKHELVRRFREDFPDHTLVIQPAVQGSVLEHALEQDQLEKVQLIRTDRPSDTFQGGSSKWVRRGAVAEVALEIRSRENQRLLGNLIRRYLRGEEGVFGEIVEFEGLQFEHAKVQVATAEGSRTYNIERPTAGHAMTVDIEADLKFRGGWATEASLFPALRRALP